MEFSAIAYNVYDMVKKHYQTPGTPHHSDAHPLTTTLNTNY